MWHYPPKIMRTSGIFFLTLQFFRPPTKKSKKPSHTFGLATRNKTLELLNICENEIWFPQKKLQASQNIQFIFWAFQFFFCKISRERRLAWLHCAGRLAQSALPADCPWPVSGHPEDTQLSRSALSCCYHFYTLTIFSSGISVFKALQRMTCQVKWS